MYVIVTYDVGVKRNSKVLKTCRKYLDHKQKSVFEGFISEKKLSALKAELQKLINPEDDQIAIYEFDTLRYTTKEIIGIHASSDNIL